MYCHGCRKFVFQNTFTPSSEMPEPEDWTPGWWWWWVVSGELCKYSTIPPPLLPLSPPAASQYSDSKRNKSLMMIVSIQCDSYNGSPVILISYCWPDTRYLSCWAGSRVGPTRPTMRQCCNDNQQDPVVQRPVKLFSLLLPSRRQQLYIIYLDQHKVNQ